MDRSNFCVLWRKISHCHANSDVSQCLWICLSLYENIKIWLLARYLVFWPLPIICPTWVHTWGHNIEEGWAEHRYKGRLPFFLSVSLRTAAAVIEAAASTCRMQLESDEPASSFPLCCAPFPPTVPSPAGNWLAHGLKGSPTDQYLSSPAMPELSIHVTGVPRSSRWDKCQDMPLLFEARLLRWSTATS